MFAARNIATLENGLDKDAAGYISGVVSAGATVSGVQYQSINRFYKLAKSSGYYTSIKRLYLPIWGVAAANAIDMITGTSGTFNGGVTHGAGFVQGNGTTGYFDTGVTGASLSLTVQNAATLALVFAAGSTSPSCLIGARDISGALFSKTTGTGTGQSIFSYHGNVFATGTVNTTVNASYTGIIVASKTGTDQQIYIRNQAGFASVASGVKTLTGNVTANYNLQAMRTNTATPLEYSDSSLGVYGVSLNLHTHASDFSLHLKNLWESCTGLTLP